MLQQTSQHIASLAQSSQFHLIFSWVASSRSNIPVNLPSRITAILSLMASTSGRSDETMITAFPCLANSLIKLVYLNFGSINTASRLVQYDDLGVAAEPLG